MSISASFCIIKPYICTQYIHIYINIGRGREKRTGRMTAGRGLEEVMSWEVDESDWEIAEQLQLHDLGSVALVKGGGTGAQPIARAIPSTKPKIPHTNPQQQQSHSFCAFCGHGSTTILRKING